MLLITAAAHRHSEAGCVQEEQTEKKNVELGGASGRRRGFKRGRGFTGRGFMGDGLQGDGLQGEGLQGEGLQEELQEEEGDAEC